MNISVNIKPAKSSSQCTHADMQATSSALPVGPWPLGYPQHGWTAWPCRPLALRTWWPLSRTHREHIAHKFFSPRDRLYFSINEANRAHAVLPTCHNTVYHVPYAIPCPNYTHIQSRGCVLPAAHPDPSPPRTRTRTRTRSRAHRRSRRRPHVSRHWR